MKLSVVIVNYNVKHFLEQCLLSVRKAIQGIEAEIFVVDNNSVDHSVMMIRDKFQEVILIDNNENLGFARANNQAIRLAKGEYVLLLNPDTIVEDDTFHKALGFMDEHPEAGGLGVKMIDGKGKFLPESKRGLPTPAVAFYKISGLSGIFPRSKKFGHYHLGYLDKDEIHQVDILSGAFMLLRKEALDKSGLLDEAFFMYGEDIDLSYRLILAGYKNYYFPKTRIIHYKGESTKKSSINYVRMFYNAMIIFAKKHFSAKSARAFSLLINLAVYFRALLAVLSRFIKRIFLPVCDALMVFAGIFLITQYWEQKIVYLNGGHYPVEFIAIALPSYIIIWLFSVYLSGGYDRPVRLLKIYQGFFIGTVVILVIYALLSETYRFSRAIIVLGALWGIISITGLRFILQLMKLKDFQFGREQSRRFVIIGEPEEALRVADILRKTYVNPGFIGLASVTQNTDKHEGFIGQFNQIKEIITIYKIDEVIFCAKDISAEKIIDTMSDLRSWQVDCKIAPPESLSIIGSNFISTSGDPYIVDINSIDKISNRRNKRFFDIFSSILFIITFPLFMFVVRNPLGLLRNILFVLIAKRSWTGYYSGDHNDISGLPRIRKGVLNPTDAFYDLNFSDETINRLNLLYARDYKILNEFNIIYRGFRQLGRS
ncbi:MAG: glycosyltransferase [Bacteroidetes bacterium]|nr:glycosyltransferase [Bacteroidota bacterium]